jgi:CheY-like chemotaxis protein
VVVVDDHAELRKLVGHVLGLEGYRVTPVASATAALELFQHEIPDLIVLDIMMPEMNGYELLERLRADRRLTAVPVIFLSALGDNTSIERGRRLGVDHYLVKPFAAKQLLSTVSGTLRRYAELRRAAVIARPGGEPPTLPPDFAPIGIGPIDDQVGGLSRGRVYHVLGRSGAAKSILALQFLHAGIERGEGGVLITTERVDTVLYVGASVGLDLRLPIASGRLIVLGLVDRFERSLQTRDDIGAMLAELATHGTACDARRIVVSSILTLLGSAPRLSLSAPAMTDLVSGFERTGATTLLVSDEPVTEQEELATAFLRRNVFGTIVVDKETGGSKLGIVRCERMLGVTAEPTPRAFRIGHGTGLLTVDPSAELDVYDKLAALRHRIEVEAAGAEEGNSGLVRILAGGYRLRDAFALFLRECLSAALQATWHCALLVARFDLRGPSGAASTELPSRDLAGLLAGQEILCWMRPSEIVVLALGADRGHTGLLEGRLRERIQAIAAARGLELLSFQVCTAVHPEDGEAIDGLLETLARGLARMGDDGRSSSQVA